MAVNLHDIATAIRDRIDPSDDGEIDIPEQASPDNVFALNSQVIAMQNQLQNQQQYYNIFQQEAQRLQNTILNGASARNPQSFSGMEPTARPREIDPFAVYIDPSRREEEAPRKVKKLKLKKDTVNKDVQAILLKNKNKSSDVVSKWREMVSARIIQGNQHLEEVKKEVQKHTRELVFFDKKKELFSSPDIEKKIEEDLKNLSISPLIKNILVDNNERIFLSTNILKTTVDGQEMEIGEYQIRVDFSIGDIVEGVRVLNVTQRMDDCYDSPTITRTHCCWGNAREDILRDYISLDLQELAIDMIEYISSPHVQHGYLKDWNTFLEKAKRMSKDFSWETFKDDSRYESTPVATPWITGGDIPLSSFGSGFGEGINTLPTTTMGTGTPMSGTSYSITSSGTMAT